MVTTANTAIKLHITNQHHNKYNQTDNYLSVTEMTLPQKLQMLESYIIKK